MIKVGIISDLHSEFWSANDLLRIGAEVRERLAEADFVLLAGDIGLGANGLRIMRELFPVKPVFFVAGNHEFYQGDYQEVLDALRDATDNLHFLHMDVGELAIADQKVRIIGTTLWTDFNLFGNPDLALLWARKDLNDFRLIRYGERKLVPQDTLEWHREQRQWLLDTLALSFDGITIVMTHHAPVSFGRNPDFGDDVLSACFASRMEDLLLRDDLPLVVWGHTHHCVDRTIEHTRFVSNQSGYLYNSGTETGQYGQIVELGGPT